MHTRWEDALGEEVNFDALTKSPDSLGEALDKLFKAWTGTFDELCAIVTPFHMRRTDVLDAVAETVPAPPPEEENEPTSKSWQGLMAGELSAKDSRRATRAVEKLRDHPDWQVAVERASSRHGIPVGTIIAFIEMESGWNPNSEPMWKNQHGKIIHGKFTKEEARRAGLKLYSSAHGLAQAMGFNVPTYARERYGAFRSENPQLNLPAQPDLYNPLTAIDFAAYHLKEIISSVNHLVDRRGAREGFKPQWKLDPGADVTYLYMAYNNGAYGYLVLRRYLENPTEKNEAGLTWFQRRKQHDRDGNEILEGVARARYARRVSQIASAIEYTPSSKRTA
jgi:hypothetical protein